MRTIKISQESVESIFRDTLVSDYQGLLQDIHDMEKRIAGGETVPGFELEDLEYWKRWAGAIEIMLEYYVADHETVIAESRLT